MTNYWGPRQWYWYHKLSYDAPERCDLNRQKIYLETLVLMTKLLPCHRCYNHFHKMCQKKKINFESQEKMIEWFWDVHNQVNQRLKKPILTREEADQIYQNQVNHLYLNQYLLYHCDRAIYGHSSLELVIQLVIRLIHLYPCLKCRTVFQKYLEEQPLDYFGHDIPSFTKWFRNFFSRQDFDKHFNKKWKKMPIRFRRR